MKSLKSQISESFETNETKADPMSVLLKYTSKTSNGKKIASQVSKLAADFHKKVSSKIKKDDSGFEYLELKSYGNIGNMLKNSADRILSKNNCKSEGPPGSSNINMKGTVLRKQSLMINSDGNRIGEVAYVWFAPQNSPIISLDHIPANPAKWLLIFKPYESKFSGSNVATLDEKTYEDLTLEIAKEFFNNLHTIIK